LNAGDIALVVPGVTRSVNIRRAWRRLSSRKHGRLQLAGVSLVAVLLGTVALRVPPAIADAQKIEGKPVPDTELASVVAGATACPTLTPTRLAGQLMALTGFDAAASASSIAGVNDNMWKKWKPAANAERDDDHANILALSHQDCEYVGELRVANIDGDPWQLTVAAQHGGIDAVISAKGVPSAQKSFVDKVAGYTAWYADTDQFNVQAAASPSAAPEAAVNGPDTTVPADLVTPITKAGQTCESVTPARIAAQLKAASNFDVNLRTDMGEGIAQFSPTMWAQYAGSKASVWNASDAIGALGEAMCDLTNQFSGFPGSDAWSMALGAFQWGPATVRQAGGLPKATVPQLATTAKGYLTGFEAAMKPKATPSVTPSTSASSSASAGPSPSVTPAKTPTTKPATKPAARPLYDPSKTYQLQDGWAGAVVELPGTDLTNTPSGTRVQLWSNLHQQDQYWTIKPSGTAGYVIITNKLMKLSLAIENGSKDDNSKLVVVTTNAGDANQQWALADAGDGKVWITNHNSGKVIDLLGDDIPPPNSDGTWNGYLVEQWSKQDSARDQRWVLAVS
jgi:hypothetical protein